MCEVEDILRGAAGLWASRGVRSGEVESALERLRGRGREGRNVQSFIPMAGDHTRASKDI